MYTKLPVSEFGRRLCIASHKAQFIPGPTGGVPCAEHKRLGQLYYGLLDERSKTMANTIWEIVNDESQATDS